ncbi:5-oxoprolinase subunit C family protein [Nocardia coubleae]|uniref:Urea amidolyase n=1 Tax=Nocardia coubleae TaxID=356147 RepID=A0A846W136_9NOCA|nr:biotin-dependent carboxyltransferase family protein [Nocardia coubleae]NKX86862.1 urea amidolyase [Nocardia coubleae]
MIRRPVLEMIDPGIQTTVQAWPGRTGILSDGYFPSGPMDHLSFRAANVLVGNDPGVSALEVDKVAVSVAFLAETQIALTGPEGVHARLNDAPVPLWETIRVSAGDTLRTANPGRPGYRLYLAVRGGFDVPEVLGSAATSVITGTGGIEGRALLRGDVLGAPQKEPAVHRRLPEDQRPRFTANWEIEILAGPRATPDFLTDEDWRDLLTMSWRVDLNSDRVGTRLHPHRFRWATGYGTVAGGHPSNVLDDAYPMGGVLANGDVLTILGMDANTSGGFAVVATVPHCALWKVGQVRPGRDTIRFREIEYQEALALNRQVDFTVDQSRVGVVR